MTKQTTNKCFPIIMSVFLSVLLCGCSESKPAPSPEIIAAFTESALNGNAEAVTQTLETSIDVDMVDANGNTALMLASFNGHKAIVKLLLKANADVNKRNPAGRTALMFAATIDTPATVKLLLESGAEVNAYDGEEQWTPLMFAAGEGHTAVVDILLDHKANPKWIDTDNDSAADFAQKRGHTELAKKLQALTK